MLQHSRKRVYNAPVDKPKLSLVPATEKPAKQKVRDNLRKTRTKGIPQCVCGSRSFVVMQTATTKQKICVMCLMDKRIVEMS